MLPNELSLPVEYNFHQPAGLLHIYRPCGEHAPASDPCLGS